MDHSRLSRRERQIMDIVYSRGMCTAAEVREELPDPPSYSAVRAALALLERKGYLHHRQDGPRYVFLPTLERRSAGKNAIRHLMDTFFDGSAEQAVATMLEAEGEGISEEGLQRLSALIEQARKEGR